MGQRSQVYIRYNKGRNLIAKHLQWNYGYYMINRTYQILDFLKKNALGEFSEFKSKNYDEKDKTLKSYLGKGINTDKQILTALIEMNLSIGSIVGSYDLIKEELKYSSNKETFKMIPKNQDNNNGILVIDLQEDNDNNIKIKYGLALGYEEGGNLDTMVSASEYLKASNQMEYIKEEEDYEEFKTMIDKQVDFIDNNFELLTNEEYKEIFEKEYEYNWCLEKEN